MADAAEHDVESAVPWQGQSLDEPFSGDLVALVEQIAGINAQTARAIPVAIWARCGGKSDPGELTDRMQSYELVKSNVMRGTVHLLTLRQYWMWRTALEPTLKRLVAGFCRGIWDAADYDKLREFGRDLMSDGRPRTRAELGSEASKHFADAEARHLGFALRMILPIVELAPEDAWRPGPTTYRQAPDVPDLVDGSAGLRDLARSFAAAFGPASVDDFAYWSGIKKTEARTVADCLEQTGTTRLPTQDRTQVHVLPEFDNLYYCRRSTTGDLYEAKRDPRFNPQRMPGSLIQGDRVVGHWTYRKDALPTLSPWEPLDESAEASWSSFTDWWTRCDT
ncbi:crosslink repair DNA glycosylase YcaQ family protein [Streptomyces sp. SID13031]|uniref:DNA glycosylase AlkZ-like family protein n=1 Tax=Streptomyces sp. SID13031 TaxID=2706046 RepID=UPI0013C6BDEC|nr:crosslink repair DNA glycosylase YcaQ family protein [Streptomyces sp. SID13031]NEA35376.1 winged helix DNA-binding domain-containing protein [Streptomyces sp. SID13031]